MHLAPKVAPGGVLFVTYGGGHIAKVAPVVHALQSRGVPCTVLALTLGYAAAIRRGLQPLGYADFLSLCSDPGRALAYGAKLRDGNRHPDVSEEESQAYLGVNYLEWVERYGEAGARERFAAGGRRSFYPVDFLGRILDAVQPSVVVSTGSPRSEQASLEAARLRGIPSVTIMDLFGLPYDPYVHQPIQANVITVMSQMVCENLMAAGIGRDRIRITGCPAYDALRDPAHAAAAAQWRAGMGWDKLHVVMWAGYKEEGAHVPAAWRDTGFGLEVERRLRDWVRSRPDVALLVRYHPNQCHEFPDLGPQERVYLARPTHEPVQLQLHASDTVIVQTSTVGLEAALIGKRVLNLRYAPSVIDLAFDYSELGMATGIPSMEALVPTLDAPEVTALPARVLPPAGPAAPRVAAEIAALREARLAA